MTVYAEHMTVTSDVTPEGGVYTVPAGGSIQFQWSVEEGYIPLSAQLDGNPLDIAAGSCALENVAENHTLTLVATRQLHPTINSFTISSTYKANEAPAEESELSEGEESAATEEEPVN